MQLCRLDRGIAEKYGVLLRRRQLIRILEEVWVSRRAWTLSAKRRAP